ncbi:DUF6527 family protein [Variovorax sp. LjRoot84]|uniref:DUF6527 family protein n=1 Tax=Variovorax sp. LjRoot84 TaxID=3342340 RepID=UPI003ECC7201
MSKVKRVVTVGGQFYGVTFECPGCGYSHTLPTQETPPGVTTAPRWTFNGDYDRPTLTPSILSRAETWTPPVTPENLDEWKRAPWPQAKVAGICHSFVTDGRIQFLGDCTHALAGQTVELEEIGE